MLDPESPTLIYNLARVHELLGQLDRALPFYREYLHILPEQDAEARERTAETIDRLQGARGQIPSQAGPTGPADEDQQMDAPVWVERWGVADVAFWATAGSAGVLLIAGTAFGISALSAEADAEAIVVRNEDDAVAYEAAALNADDRAFVADILIVGGLATAVVAGLLYALRSETVETHPSYGDTQAFVTSDGERTMIGLRGAL